MGSRMKKYPIVEIFRSIQGEGVWSGRPAVFIRFAGCNMWSGLEEHRGRDAERNGVRCPRWCDTDFRKGLNWSAVEIARYVGELNPSKQRMIVLTGGEPALHVDVSLLRCLRNESRMIAIETNGSIAIEQDVLAWIDWVTCSPKQKPSQIKLNRCSELKVVFESNGTNPNEYLSEECSLSVDTRCLYVQPELSGLAPWTTLGELRAHVRDVVQFIDANPDWKLSCQLHKLVGAK